MRLITAFVVLATFTALQGAEDRTQACEALKSASVVVCDLDGRDSAACSDLLKHTQACGPTLGASGDPSVERSQVCRFRQQIGGLYKCSEGGKKNKTQGGPGKGSIPVPIEVILPSVTKTITVGSNETVSDLQNHVWDESSTMPPEKQRVRVGYVSTGATLTMFTQNECAMLCKNLRSWRHSRKEKRSKYLLLRKISREKRKKRMRERKQKAKAGKLRKKGPRSRRRSRRSRRRRRRRQSSRRLGWGRRRSRRKNWPEIAEKMYAKYPPVLRGKKANSDWVRALRSNLSKWPVRACEAACSSIDVTAQQVAVGLKQEGKTKATVDTKFGILPAALYTIAKVQVQKEPQKVLSRHGVHSLTTYGPWRKWEARSATFYVTMQAIKVVQCVTPKSAYATCCDRGTASGKRYQERSEKMLANPNPKSVDACGCKLGEQGWSRRRRPKGCPAASMRPKCGCTKGSTTNSLEAKQCSKRQTKIRHVGRKACEQGRCWKYQTPPVKCVVKRRTWAHKICLMDVGNMPCTDLKKCREKFKRVFRGPSSEPRQCWFPGAKREASLPRSSLRSLLNIPNITLLSLKPPRPFSKDGEVDWSSGALSRSVVPSPQEIHREGFLKQLNAKGVSAFSHSQDALFRMWKESWQALGKAKRASYERQHKKKLKEVPTGLIKPIKKKYSDGVELDPFWGCDSEGRKKPCTHRPFSSPATWTSVFGSTA